MVPEPHILDFQGHHVFVGLDVAKHRWQVSILLENGQVHRSFSQPPQPEVLANYLKRNFPGASYYCAYEAGFSGFWTYQALTALGVHCVVVNPGDVATTNKERQCKTDRIDAQKLARELASGGLHPIYVPSRRVQEDRSLVRLRASFVRKQTRTKNQIKALLQYYGIAPNELTSSAESHWSGRFIQWLRDVEFCHPSGRTSLDALLNELLALRETIATLTRQIRLLAEQDVYRSRFELLRTVPGVSLLIAMTFLTEIGTIDRFDGLDTLASFVGLVPGEHSTGDRQVNTGITRRHNKVLRAMLVESAWVAVRRDPALMMAFNRLSSRMPKQCAIIRIARKLLNRMRTVLVTQTPYQLRTV